MLCEKCGKGVSEGASFCKHCGHTLGSKPKDSDKIFCKKCKTENPVNSNFCKSCGTKLHSKHTAKKEVNSEKKTKKKKGKSERITCAHCDKYFTVKDLTEKDIREGYTVECDYCGEDVEVEGEEEEVKTKPSKATYHHKIEKKSYAWVWVLVGIVIFIIIVSVFLGGFQSRSGPTCRTYTVEKAQCDDDPDCSCTEKALWGVGWCKKCSCTSCYGD